MTDMMATAGMNDVGFVMEFLLAVCGLMIAYGAFRISRAFNQLRGSDTTRPTMNEELFMLKLQDSISQN